MFKVLISGSKVILASAALILINFYLIDVLGGMTNLYPHSMKFKILLAIIFFVMSVLLMAVANKVTKNISTKQSNMKFAQIFDLLGEEISILDPKTLKFTYLNKSLLNNTQYEKNELIDKYITAANPDCELEEMKKTIKPLITGEINILIYETMRERKDGSKYQIITKLKYFNDTKTLIAFSKELTNEKNSIINHELRTSLTATAGSLKIISSGLVGEVPIPMLEMLNVANNNCTRLLDLVNDLTCVEKN